MRIYKVLAPILLAAVITKISKALTSANQPNKKIATFSRMNLSTTGLSLATPRTIRQRTGAEILTSTKATSSTKQSRCRSNADCSEWQHCYMGNCMVLTGYDFAKDKYCSANDRLAGPFTTLLDAKIACDQDNLCEMIEDWGCGGSGYHTCKSSDSDHYGRETCVWARQYGCKDVYSLRDCTTVKHTGACATKHYSYCKKSCSCDTCSPNPCKNNGTCYTYSSGWIVCRCQEHWTGLRCEYYDAYLEISGSRCLRTDKYTTAFNSVPDGLMPIDYAMEECSEKRRCVGIEYVSSVWTPRGLNKLYKFCLDAIYTSTAWDK